MAQFLQSGRMGKVKLDRRPGRAAMLSSQIIESFLSRYNCLGMSAKNCARQITSIDRVTSWRYFNLNYLSHDFFTYKSPQLKQFCLASASLITFPDYDQGIRQNQFTKKIYLFQACQIPLLQQWVLFHFGYAAGI